MLLITFNCPCCSPVAVGVKSIPTVQLVPPASVPPLIGHVVVPAGVVWMANSVVAVPVLAMVSVMLLISSVPVPAITLSVAVIGPLAVFTIWFGNEMDDAPPGPASIGLGAIPVPVSITVGWVPVALSVTISVVDSNPAVDGLKVNSTVHPGPGLMLMGYVALHVPPAARAKSPALPPLVPRAVMVSVL